jgi:hypothetical protein
MALTSKKYSAVHSKTGGEKAKLQANFDDGHINTLADLAENGTNPEFGALIYQMQEMQDELDYLRTEISANKDKVIPNVTGTTNHAISFGALTTTLVKGKPVYSVVMTVTDSSGTKVVAKTITLTLA